MWTREPQPFFPAFMRISIYSLGAYYALDFLNSQDRVVYWLGYGAATLCGIGAIKNLFLLSDSSRHTGVQSNTEMQSRIPSGTFGNARLARACDPVIKTLSPRKGFFLGALNNLPLFFDPFAAGNGHMLTYGPARTGKTTSVVIPAALHWFGGSLFLPNIKGDVAAIAATHRRSKGHRVVIWNPFNILKLGGKGINPLAILLEDVNRNGGKNLHDMALLIGVMLLPEQPNEKEPFFRNGGRRFIVALLLYMAVIEKGLCHLPGLRKLVWADMEKKQQIASALQHCEGYGGLLKEYGAHLTELLDPAYTKTFGAMRDHAIDATQIYDGHSDFGKSLMTNEFSLSEMLDGKTTFFPILPENKLETHGVVIGLMSALLFEMIGASPRRSPIMFLLEEAGNLGRIPNLAKALTLLPEKGVRVWFVFQSRMQLMMRYGQELAALVEDQCSMIQQWSIRDLEERKRWSARSGKTTAKTLTQQYDPRDALSPWKQNNAETERPVLTEDQVALLPANQQLIFIAGQPVIKAQLVPYFQVGQWRRCAAPNPYHPHGYPKDKPVVINLGKGHGA